MKTEIVVEKGSIQGFLVTPETEFETNLLKQYRFSDTGSQTPLVAKWATVGTAIGIGVDYTKALKLDQAAATNE